VELESVRRILIALDLGEDHRTMLEAILFTTGAEPVVSDVDPNSLQELVRESSEPRVYVVREPDLQCFARSTAALEPQRQAHQKQLKRYAIKREQARLIYSYQVEAWRVLDGVRNLCDQASEPGYCKLYIVSVRTGDKQENARWRDVNPDISAAPTDVFSQLLKNVPVSQRGDTDQTLEREMLGCSPRIKQLRREIRIAAKRNDPVLLRGETGTGKTTIARVLRGLSPRKSGPFVQVNCPAINRETYKSEMHGVVKNFPGFHNPEPLIGLLEQADGGILFLDEVGDLLPEVQAQMLADLDLGATIVKPLGSQREKQVDFRVIAASDRNLPELATQGGFRDQLYQRLSGITIVTPSLRDCEDDITEIARVVWSRAVADAGSPSASREVATVPDALLDEFKAYPWPGNVRELEKMTRRLVYARLDEEDVDLLERFKILLEEESWQGYRGDRGGALGRLPIYQQVEESLRQAREAVRPIFAGEETDIETQAYVQAVVQGHIKSLEVLCSVRSLAENDEIFQLVEMATSVLRRFSHSAEAENGRRQPWHDDAERQFDEAQRHVRSNVEQAAEEVYRSYLDTKKRMGEDADLVSYDELPSDLRESNRQQFLHMPKIYRAVGYWIRPARSEEIREPDLTNEELKQMAMLEHDRWVEERTKAGWKYAETKNVAARETPYLVTWKDLPDDVRRFDQDAVRSFPRILRTLSIELYKPTH
jgi:DNA-binding NtrC family response regulator